MSKTTVRAAGLSMIVLLCSWPRSAGGQSAGIVAAASGLAGLSRIAPTPNYITCLKRRESYRKFPLKVAFVRDKNYAAAREAMAVHGFSRWIIASDGILDFVVAADPFEADILVIFDPMTQNGLTRSGVDKAHRRRSVITIGVRPGLQTDVEAIAAHEYGHALGIDGHSDSKRDLMYPYHREGAHGRPSARDLNTMSALYPSLTRLIMQRDRAAGTR